MMARRIWAWTAACGLLAACASPSAEYLGVTPQRVTVDGWEFLVYHRETRAQVIRLGLASRVEQAAMPARMVAAIGLATGCAVVPASISGDAGVIDARMDCGRS